MAGPPPATPEDAQPPSDWVPVQPPAEPAAPQPEPPATEEQRPEPPPNWGASWTPHEPAAEPSWTSQTPPPEVPPARGRHEAPADPAQETPLWVPHEPSAEEPPPARPAQEAPPPRDTPASWGQHEPAREFPGRHERAADEPFLPGKGLAAEPPSMTTAPDPHWSAVPEPRWGEPQETAATPGPMADPARRKALADAFVAEFVSSTTWRATLAVLEGAFPGLGMAGRLSHQTDDLWRTMDAVDRKAAAKLGVPVWLDDAGMVFDLSAHLRPVSLQAPPGGRVGPPRASKPYAGAFVIDTLDPLRYHRAVGGPRAPRDLPGQGVPVPPIPEDDDSGVVIVANLTSAGVRVLDSAGLWRYAGHVVTATLHEVPRPETRSRTRRALWALRRVVFVDPDLGLGLCLQIDAGRVPRCLLAFGVDRTEGAPRFVRP
ncbi:hypothetical protein [Actinomadura sp. 3N508]|uniref:hypothetical protein n=1 Tax=Actinomadura sp. 3N508 TaxID=3375153 RepID=UPI003797D313